MVKMDRNEGNSTKQTDKIKLCPLKKLISYTGMVFCTRLMHAVTQLNYSSVLLFEMNSCTVLLAVHKRPPVLNRMCSWFPRVTAAPSTMHRKSSSCVCSIPRFTMSFTCPASRYQRVWSLENGMAIYADIHDQSNYIHSPDSNTVWLADRMR
jgi:hypothetical protein